MPGSSTYKRHFGSVREAIAATILESSIARVTVDRHDETETDRLEPGESTTIRGESIVVEVANDRPVEE